MLLLFLVLLVLSGTAVQAQQADKSFYYDYGEKFYYNIANVPYERADSTRFLVSFRMRNDVLLFTRLGGRYEAAPLLYVEFIDSTGIIRLSREWRSTVVVPTYERTQSKKEFVEGALSVELPPGTYTVVFELGDNNAPRTSRFRVTGVAGKDFFASRVIGRPLFVRPLAESDTYRPFILKGNISFPSQMRALVSVSGVTSRDEFLYSIEQVEEQQNLQPDDPVVDVPPITGTVTPVMNTVPSIAFDTASTVLIRTTRLFSAETQPVSAQSADRAAPDVGMLEIRLPEEIMPSGLYTLRLHRRGGSDTLTHQFSLVWEDKPLSMRNIQYAVELAYYVMTDEEYDRVNSGSLEAKRRKLFEFWSSKDPDPATVFNEAMAEYYRRVDYAFFNFQTLAERDGARTDRGKIYILHGPPTSVDRNLEPDAPVVELWRYTNSVNKVFVFESTVPGMFSLKEIREL